MGLTRSVHIHIPRYLAENSFLSEGEAKDL